MRSTLRIACGLALLLISMGSGPSRGQDLIVPAVPDSAPPESRPAPLLRPGAIDSTRRTAKELGAEQARIGRGLESIEPGAAIVAYRNALRYDPTIPEIHARIAALFMTRQQYGEAARHYAAELERDPDHRAAGCGLGLALAHLGDTARATPLLQRMVRTHRKASECWHALGFAHAQAGRLDQAETALQRAIELPPPSAEEHRDLAVVLSRERRDKDARTQYRRALKLDPGDATSWFNLGNLERRAGRLDSALACYRRAEASDTLGPGLLGQIQVLREQGRDEEAGRVYRRWLARDPLLHTVRIDAIQLYGAIGREDIALEIARDGVREAGGSSETHEIYAMTLADQGQYRRALDELQRARWLSRRDPRAAGRVRGLMEKVGGAAPDSLRQLYEAALADTTFDAAAP